MRTGLNLRPDRNVPKDDNLDVVLLSSSLAPGPVRSFRLRERRPSTGRGFAPVHGTVGPTVSSFVKGG